MITTLAIIVAVLGAGAVITFIGTRLIERAHRPRGRFIDIGGFPQHVAEMGPRDAHDMLPVAVLHGAGANLEDMHLALAEQLAGRRRVIFVDRPGLGFSARRAEEGASPAYQAAVLRDVLDRLGVERAIVVGHSWSGALALTFALDFPARAAGLVQGQRAVGRGRSVRLRDRHAVPCRRGVRYGAPLYRPVRERPAGRAAACHRWRKPGRYHPLHLAGELFSSIRRLGDGPSGTGGGCRQARHRVLHLHEGDARFPAGINAPEPGGPHDDDWHRAICSVLYMLFLGLESARKAIKDLVEFEPKQAEDMSTILLSELLAYGFLREQFRGDIRQRRLEARDEAYRREIPALHRLVVAGAGPQWEAAKDLSAEMMLRFDRVLMDTPTVRTRKAARGLLEAVS